MGALDLHATAEGPTDAPPLYIAHGLLGNARNWTTIQRHLAARFRVHCLDLRNHGDSPHDESMRWSDISGDLRRLAERPGAGPGIWIGHSLGGKAVMRLAVEHPQLVDGLVVCDIAQRHYPPFHATAFGAMEALDLGQIASRREADAFLEKKLPDPAFRQFILTNLVLDRDSGRYRWKVNLPVLARSLAPMARPSIDPEDRYPGPTLLIAGRASPFVTESDIVLLRRSFSQLSVKWLEGVGHNVHIENRPAFLDALEPFLDAIHPPSTADL